LDGREPITSPSSSTAPAHGLSIRTSARSNVDLILAIYSGLKRNEYDKLSKIAPVVAQPKDEPDWGSSWQEETLITGRAVGRPKAARRLVEKTERLVADTAAEHPEFRRLSPANVADYQGVFVYGRQDVRTRMLEALGFTFPDTLSKATKGGFGGQLSDERTDLLDVSALLWFAEPAGARKIRRKPVYPRLKVRPRAARCSSPRATASTTRRRS
jgi:iron complex transport system substrate-binding protein